MVGVNGHVPAALFAQLSGTIEDLRDGFRELGEGRYTFAGSRMNLASEAFRSGLEAGLGLRLRLKRRSLVRRQTAPRPCLKTPAQQSLTIVGLLLSLLAAPVQPFDFLHGWVVLRGLFDGLLLLSGCGLWWVTPWGWLLIPAISFTALSMVLSPVTFHYWRLRCRSAFKSANADWNPSSQAATKGQQIRPSETVLQFRLKAPLSVAPLSTNRNAGRAGMG